MIHRAEDADGGTAAGQLRTAHTVLVKFDFTDAVKPHRDAVVGGSARRDADRDSIVTCQNVIHAGKKEIQVVGIMRGTQCNLRLRFAADKERVGIAVPVICIPVCADRDLRRVDPVV